MRSLTESDVFKTLNSNNQIINKINIVTKDVSGKTKEISMELDEYIKQIERHYKSPMTYNAVNAVREGRIRLVFAESPEYTMPVSMPFHKYVRDGKVYVDINVTRYTSKRSVAKATAVSEEQYTYQIKPQQLYSLLIPAYAFLDVFTPKYIMDSGVATIVAEMWSTMAVNVLAKLAPIKSSQEKFDTYRYLCAKFFCIYYLDYPEPLAINVAKSIIKIIPFMVTEIEDADQKNEMYTSFNTFISHITQYQFIKSKNKGLVTPQMFIKKFIDSYDFVNINSLSTFPYFFFTIFSTYNNSYLGGDRAFDPIVHTSKDPVTKFCVSVFK